MSSAYQIHIMLL
jgi:hypothetical protein